MVVAFKKEEEKEDKENKQNNKSDKNNANDEANPWWKKYRGSMTSTPLRYGRYLDTPAVPSATQSLAPEDENEKDRGDDAAPVCMKSPPADERICIVVRRPGKNRWQWDGG